MKHVVVVDCGLGNLHSLLSALHSLGITYDIDSDSTYISSAKALILPGVGSFPAAIKNLVERSQLEQLKLSFSSGTPILGICLGCQLLMDGSQENGNTPGLSFIPGMVKKISSSQIRVPNVGWHRVSKASNHYNSLDPFMNDKYFYFIHSYQCHPNTSEHILAKISIPNQSINAAIAFNNALGLQFHPEKSSSDGLSLLEAYLTSYY